MIPDIAVDVDAEAVVVRAERPLRAVSSAIVGGGLVEARAIVNLHVPKGFQCADSEGHLAEFARRRAVPAPFVGLLTGAATDRAELATEHLGGLSASAVVTVGLSNRSAAGRSAQAMWRPSTINTIVLVDAAPEDAALVNLVITATEAKALALAEAGISTREGGVVTGTSTDAVVVAATGRGPGCRFGGPVSDLGWLVARAVKAALDAGVARWIAEAR
jgi:iron complex transport system ATP-binding protein